MLRMGEIDKAKASKKKKENIRQSGCPNDGNKKTSERLIVSVASGQSQNYASTDRVCVRRYLLYFV